MQGIMKTVSSTIVGLGKVANPQHADEPNHKYRRPVVKTESVTSGRPPYWPNERMNYSAENSKHRSNNGNVENTAEAQLLRAETNKELIRSLQTTLARTIAAVDPTNPNIQLLQKLPDL